MASWASPFPAWPTKLLTPRTISLCILLLAGLGLLYTITPPRDPTRKLLATAAAPEDVEPVERGRKATLPTEQVAEQDSGTPTANSYCADYPDNGAIALVVKTAATVALDRLPTQLLTSLHCLGEPIIVSDLAQTVGLNQVHDVLARVAPEIKRAHVEFETYRKQQELMYAGQWAALRSQAEVLGSAGEGGGRRSAAAGLDRWKWLRMVEKAWEVQPERQWYVFVGDEVYLSWRNVRHLLAGYHHSEAWYLGHEVREAGAQALASGEGSGVVVLSGHVVRDWVTQHPGLASRWDKRIEEMKDGSEVLAKVLDEVLGVRLTDVGPVLQPHAPETVPFGPDVWCKEVVSLHHLGSRQMDNIFRAEMALSKNSNTSPLRFRDIYHSAYLTGFPFKREDWDNLAADPDFALEVRASDITTLHGMWEPKDFVDPHMYFSGCEMACIQAEACMQFASLKTTGEDVGDAKAECFLSSVFRLGRARKEESWRDGEGEGEGKEGKRVWMSGWRSDRIARWVEGHEGCG
ncbi:hypothetical protein LTR08_001892 [Meristemomyces frigidus]|nr:hypothetical protein LTR08_001892 [Meristemomyces frigidus]